jgi:hypothetical protein
VKPAPFPVVKTILPALLLAVSGQWLGAQGLYSHFIRQVQMPSGVQWDVPVTLTGARNSQLSIDGGGARFELWTVLSSPVASYLLDTRFVSTYAPVAEVAITSEDPYRVLPRTRADRPFQVTVQVQGLLNQTGAPEASMAVKFLRHAQSYGPLGVGENLDRSQATLINQSLITRNGPETLSYTINSVPGANRAKVRGEERFSVYSLADPASLSPESQIASRHIQIWPVADGSITGVQPGQKVRMQMPQLTFTVNDIYPGGMIHAQAYQGPAKLGTAGTLIPGTSYGPIGDVPENKIMVLDRYDSVFGKDGIWTVELLTTTPFGVDRLAHVSFEIDREITVNGNITTIE